MGKSLIRILIVDDHDLVRTGLRRMLEDVAGLKIIGEADSGEEAVRQVRELRPQVVLMDIKMPGIGGLEATRKLLRIDPDIKVLVVTICDDDLYPARLLQAGAAGYITKGASLDEMVRAIKCVCAGQRYISPEVAQHLALRRITDDDESPFEKLSERELQVVLMIAQGLRIQSIADHLHLSTKTINSYRYRIFEKMKVETDVELTLLAMRYGIVEPESVAK